MVGRDETYEVTMEQEWKVYGKMWYDMDSDGMSDFIKSTVRKSKIDQVLDFYGIPHKDKNNYKKYLKFKIQERHRGVVQSYFLGFLQRESPEDVVWFDFGKLQKQYIEEHPEDEHTGLNIKVQYEKFLEKDKEHQDALIKKNEQSTSQEKINTMMMDVMSQMMTEMKSIKSTIWALTPYLPKPNEWNNDKETNAQTQSWEAWAPVDQSNKWDSIDEWGAGWPAWSSWGGGSTWEDPISPGVDSPIESAEDTGPIAWIWGWEWSDDWLGLDADSAASLLIPDDIWDRVKAAKHKWAGKIQLEDWTNADDIKPVQLQEEDFE